MIVVPLWHMCICALMDHDLREFVGWPVPPEWLAALLRKDIFASRGVLSLPELQLTSHSPEKIKSWLESICRYLGIKPSYLALRSGLAASTINRFLRGEGKRNTNLTATTIEKIKETFDAIYKEQISERNRSDSDDNLPFCYFPRLNMYYDAPLVGTIANGEQCNINEWWARERADATLPLSMASAGDVVAMRIKRGGANIYPNNSLIFGMMLCTMKYFRIDGAHVIAFTRDRNGVSCGIWRYILDPASRAWLMPLDVESDEPGFYMGGEPRQRNDAYISHLVVAALREV